MLLWSVSFQNKTKLPTKELKGAYAGELICFSEKSSHFSEAICDLNATLFYFLSNWQHKSDKDIFHRLTISLWISPKIHASFFARLPAYDFAKLLKHTQFKQQSLFTCLQYLFTWQFSSRTMMNRRCFNSHLWLISLKGLI